MLYLNDNDTQRSAGCHVLLLLFQLEVICFHSSILSMLEREREREMVTQRSCLMHLHHSCSSLHYIYLPHVLNLY